MRWELNHRRQQKLTTNCPSYWRLSSLLLSASSSIVSGARMAPWKVSRRARFTVELVSSSPRSVEILGRSIRTQAERAREATGDGIERGCCLQEKEKVGAANDSSNCLLHKRLSWRSVLHVELELLQSLRAYPVARQEACNCLLLGRRRRCFRRDKPTGSAN